MVFDEWYYVNAVRNILGRPMIFGYGENSTVVTNGSITKTMSVSYFELTSGRFNHNVTMFTDPNTEHPPLAKLIVAFSTVLLGESALAYRLPGVIFGTLLILFFYLAAKKLVAERMALYATALLAFETLTLVQSRVFMLDIFMVSFMVLGLYLFLCKRVFLAGVVFGLSALCKEMGVIGPLIVMTFWLLEQRQTGGFRFRETVEFVVKTVVGFALPVGLLMGAVAVWWGIGPVQQLLNITALTRIGGTGYYSWDGAYVTVFNGVVQHVFGMVSPPWLWLLDSSVIEYANFAVGSTFVVNYVAEMNPFLVLNMLPAVFFSVMYYKHEHGRADLFALVWWAWSYLIWFPVAAMGRPMYIFYMLPVMGSIALMVSNMLFHLSVRPYVRCLFLLAVVAFMVLLFPIKLQL